MPGHQKMFLDKPMLSMALQNSARQRGCLVKWGFGIDKTLEQTKLFVLYSNSTKEFVYDKKFYVEEYLDYRQVTLPLGIKARLKKDQVKVI